MGKLGFEEKPVYRIEPADELQNLMAALRTSEDPLAVFIDHAQSSVLKNPVNLRLLKQYADDLERRVVIISDDPVVKALAEDGEIDCYPNEYELYRALGLLQEGEAVSGEDEGKGAAGGSFTAAGTRRRLFSTQQLAVLVIAALAIGLLYYLYVPKVRVVVTPEVLVYRQGFELLGVSRDGTAVPSDQPVLPLYPVTAVIETEAVVSATGSQILGTAPARGTVVFINEGDEPVEVPKGTRLKTGEGIVFETDASVVVPGRSTEYFLDVATGVRAGQKEVTVTALEPGEEGNVAAGRVRFFADSAWEERLAVRNPEPFRGGASVQQIQVTSADIERAEAACRRQAGLKAAEILQAKADEEGFVLILESVQLEKESSQSEAEIGQEVETVKVTARFRALGESFRRQELGELLRQEMEARLPEDLVLFQPKFEIEQLSASVEDGNIVLSGEAAAPVHRRLPEAQLAALFAGLERREVDEMAKVLDAASIVIEPADVGHLPRLAHWIRVEVTPPEAVTAGGQP
ncbi:MAG: hypothetical protein GX063_02305 [Firmicutes bacterium]|nr:hypothetical protein [Bacillota bacterium]